MPTPLASAMSLNGYTRGELDMDNMDSSRVFVKDVKRVVVKVCEYSHSFLFFHCILVDISLSFPCIVSFELRQCL